jgi:hypothetical protein
MRFRNCAVTVILFIMFCAQNSIAQQREVLVQDMPQEAREALLRLKNDLNIDLTRELTTKAEVLKLNNENYEDLKEILEPFPGVHITEIDGDYRALLHKKAVESTSFSQAQSRLFEKFEAAETTRNIELVRLAPQALSSFALTEGFDQKDGCTKSGSFILPLPGGKELEVVRDSITLGDGGLVWRGTPKSGKGSVVLMTSGDSLTGTIRLGNKIYALKPVGGGLHAVIEKSFEALPPEHPPIKVPDTSGLDMPDGERLAPDDVVEVVLLIAYTSKAAGEAVEIEGDVCRPAVEYANIALRESGNGKIRLKVADIVETDYRESDFWSNHLKFLENRSDDVMDELHILRDEHNADIVILVVADSTFRGEVTTVRPGAGRSFCVVNQEAAATHLSLAHEVGHIFGAGHNTAADENPFHQFGHGYVHKHEFRTIMSYGHGCLGCSRVPRWSGPDVLYQGQKCGTQDRENNALVIDINAKRVSKFR